MASGDMAEGDPALTTILALASPAVEAMPRVGLNRK
jgi:hypothetical protein